MNKFKKNISSKITIQKNKGFTVVELIIAIIIITIVSSIIVALLPNMTDSSRQASTVTNLRSISSALSLYRTDHNSYPIADNIEALATILEPDYINKMVQHDGWGKNFYVNSSQSTFTIGSGGKGWDGQTQLTSDPKGPTHTFESDIIITDGIFTQFPARSN
ncbi:MAG: type II secretion system protein GspG [Legionellales bacterium]|nr:type II secretion system protein GspG [Legionellales bacterium]